jgi:hypothetical protein
MTPVVGLSSIIRQERHRVVGTNETGILTDEFFDLVLGVHSRMNMETNTLGCVPKSWDSSLVLVQRDGEAFSYMQIKRVTGVKTCNTP